MPQSKEAKRRGALERWKKHRQRIENQEGLYAHMSANDRRKELIGVDVQIEELEYKLGIKVRKVEEPAASLGGEADVVVRGGSAVVDPNKSDFDRYLESNASVEGVMR